MFVVSEYEYARDEAVFNGSMSTAPYSVSVDGDQQVGNVFDVYKTSMVYEISAYIHEDNTSGTEAKAELNIRTSTGWVYLTESPSINVGQHSGDWINFVFQSPVEINQGDIILTTIHAEYGSSSDTVYLAVNGTSLKGESLYQDIDGVSNDEEPGKWYYTNETPMVRLNFNPNAEAPVSINENILSDEFMLYPNPNDGLMTIEIKSDYSENFNFSVFNILGQEVYQENINHNMTTNKEIDLKHLKKGLYMVYLSNESGNTTAQKVVVQ